MTQSCRSGCLGGGLGSNTGGTDSLLGTLLGVSLVTDELGVNTAERGVSRSLGLLDTVTVSLAALVVVGVVLRLGPVKIQ